MCVIAFVEKDGKRPSADQIKQMYERNPEGAGIAWREADGKKKQIRTIIHKGLNLEEILELSAKVPTPFVTHFRISTCGDKFSKRLTHPFVVDAESPLLLHGSISQPVLFHNGSWTNWENKILDLAIKGGWKIPEGNWSDSRAMAWAAAMAGFGILEFINEKALVFGTDFIKMFGRGWTRHSDGFIVSNEFWETKANFHRGSGGGYHTTPPASLTQTKTTPEGSKEDTGGSSGPAEPFREGGESGCKRDQGLDDAKDHRDLVSVSQQDETRKKDLESAVSTAETALQNTQSRTANAGTTRIGGGRDESVWARGINKKKWSRTGSNGSYVPEESEYEFNRRMLNKTLGILPGLM
jgi:hypothetical protein